MRPIRTAFSLLIITIHLGCLIVFYQNTPPIDLNKKRLVVRANTPFVKPLRLPQSPHTVSEVTTPFKPIATPISKPPKKKPLLPKTPPAAKQSPKKTSLSPKKESSKAKSSVKAKTRSKASPKKKDSSETVSSEPIIPQDLLDQLEESIAKIDQNDHKVSSKSSLTVPILEAPGLSEASIWGEVSFQEQLIECLHRSLALPDLGEVTIELKLRSNGLVAGLKVLKAESSKNRDYLEKHLPHVVFPPMEEALFKNEEKTFVLTFCNEI